MRHHILNEKEEIINSVNINNFTPAIEDIGIKYKNELTYNLMELITKIKNKDIQNNNINKELLINLFFIF